jgi:hypothetical protein
MADEVYWGRLDWFVGPEATLAGNETGVGINVA